MDALPEELRLHVLSFLTSPADLALGASLVSRAWRRIAGDDILWRRHLDRLHPDWRVVLADALRVADPTAMPARERLRLLAPHDPIAEERPNCCRHDDTRGAACLCCTCRRHHADQQWNHDWFHPTYTAVTEQCSSYIMTETYGGNVATVDTILAASADAEGRRCRMFDIEACERAGMLQRRGSRLIWTDAAHRCMRPPAFVCMQDDPRESYATVWYTDAELHVALIDHGHPPPRESAALLARHRDLLRMCDLTIGIVTDVGSLRRSACGGRTPKQVDAALADLKRAGWLAGANGSVWVYYDNSIAETLRAAVAMG
ncbi:F-box domain-containing protein [Medusavirus stheno T3]|uniref:F-box domain-containing protein n=1 Tax=Medusavirus stheno T3 TaxID=3069717 RepID=A0A7S7YFL0_9VIRU|nr:F-box domain-containing protein [Acanthamoeba castellanii medusavirus]QPB44200.1 F-box domain-containing protein [Medusavirus stheno T3]